MCSAPFRSHEVRITAEQHNQYGWCRQVSLRLHYDAIDPYAVVLIIEPQYEIKEEIWWTFEYEMLDEACGEPRGEGDIHLAPHPDAEHLVITLKPPGPSHPDFWLKLDDVEQFLEDSYELVPRQPELDELLEAALYWLPRADEH